MLFLVKPPRALAEGEHRTDYLLCDRGFVPTSALVVPAGYDGARSLALDSVRDLNGSGAVAIPRPKNTGDGYTSETVRALTRKSGNLAVCSGLARKIFSEYLKGEAAIVGENIAGRPFTRPNVV